LKHRPDADWRHEKTCRACQAKSWTEHSRQTDSQGICFVGKVGIKRIPAARLGEQPYGLIATKTVKPSASMTALSFFYTIGQRHGLNVGGGLPYYVSRKDMATNTVYVTEQS